MKPTKEKRIEPLTTAAKQLYLLPWDNSEKFPESLAATGPSGKTATAPNFKKAGKLPSAAVLTE